jgi:hypothetical protein
MPMALNIGHSDIEHRAAAQGRAQPALDRRRAGADNPRSGAGLSETPDMREFL